MLGEGKIILQKLRYGRPDRHNQETQFTIFTYIELRHTGKIEPGTHPEHLQIEISAQFLIPDKEYIFDLVYGKLFPCK
jgi:hypothetical protein